MSGPAVHPGAETLARYARGELPRGESRELELHLMACLGCQEEIDRISAGAATGKVRWLGHRFRPALENGPAPADPDKAAERRRELSQTLQALGDIIGMVGESELDELLRLPEYQRRARLRDDKRLHHLHLCELLEERCRAAWIEAPRDAVEFARMAVLLADRLDPEAYGSKRLQDFRAVAWLHLGNSFRIASEAPEPLEETAPPGPKESQDEGAYPEIRSRALTIREAAHLAEAEDALVETRDAFLRHRLDFDAALTTLELAMLYQEQERAADLRRLAGEAAPLFEEHGASAYTTDAMRFLRDRLEQQGLDLDLLETLHTFLQRRRNDPQLQPE